MKGSLLIPIHYMTDSDVHDQSDLSSRCPDGYIVISDKGTNINLPR